MCLIKEIQDKEEKAGITDSVLRQLPEWFGIEEAILEYVEGARNTDFYAAYEGKQVVGFISIRINNEYTAEVYIIGILKKYQNRGAGRRLLETVEKSLIKKGYIYLMVKTLGESHPDINYKRTRGFYRKVGFYPLEEIKEIWGPENPCLIMIKSLSHKS